MKNICKLSLTLLTTSGLVLSLSTAGLAQEAFSGLNRQAPSVNTIAGVHFTLPFGARSDAAQFKPRLGFALDIERQYSVRRFGTPERIRQNALDFGLDLKGHPVMLMGGEDIYAPLFLPQTQTGDQAGLSSGGMSRNTLLIVAGGVLATGAIVALAGNSNGGGSSNEGSGERRGDGDD